MANSGERDNVRVFFFFEICSSKINSFPLPSIFIIIYYDFFNTKELKYSQE